MQNHHGNMFNHQDQDDKSSLEAAAEAAAKVNAMLIAKGMLKPNQIHSGTNVITKKGGGPNSLVVAEVEINNLTTPCRNTLTRGTTQEEISKASGAAVTTRGRYMAPDEKARNPRDRCLYLNVQAATKESVDIAVQKINEIIKSMCGNKVDPKGRGMNPNRGGRMRPTFRPHMGNSRFNLRGQPPPPLMSLPTPPPPQGQIPLHTQPPPQTVTIMQEKLYVGLEHAPPHFDTKNKLLGPGGSYLHHIQQETGAAVSLRGRGSGFDPSGVDSTEPMHVHLEHQSLLGLQEAKKLAENLIQTVQQSYVSFQQALAAMPPSMNTGLITGVPQQPTYVEAQFTHAQQGLATISAVPEQPLQPIQPQVQQLGPATMLMPAGSVANQLPPMPQGITNGGPGQAVMIPSSINLTPVPLVSTMPVSAASMLPQPPPHIELGGQQTVMLSQQPPGPPQALAQVGIQQVVQAPAPAPQHIPAQVGAYTHVQPNMHLVSQPVSIAPPPPMVQQPGPPLIAQAPQPGQLYTPQPAPPNSISAATSLVYTMASSTGVPYYTSPKLEEEPKRRFTEEKEDKIPENLLGYQHGPPHLVNLVRSSPPPQPIQSPISQGLGPPPGTQLLQAPPHGLIHVNPMPPDQGHFAHLGGQTILQPGQQLLPPPPEGQQILGQHYHPAIQQGPPPPQHIIGMPPPGQAHAQARSPNPENGPPSQGPPQVSSATLMPPPPPPSTLASQSGDGRRDEDSRAMPPPKSPDMPWESRLRGASPSPSEPDKKKIRGILKNKQHASLSEVDKEIAELTEIKREPEDEHEDKRHPASPQYQGQPLRYPSMPSDPNLPPTPQESGLPHQHRPLVPPLPTSLPPGHHVLHQPDPSLPPQVHIAHPHMHMEGPRTEGPPAQIVIEHPGPPGAPIHLTHHRVSAPGQIHLEHSLAGPPPRQVIIEHPAPQTIQIEHPAATITGPPGHPEHVHPHVPVSHQGQPPASQEMSEFEVGAQQVPPPQFHQTFEHITVSQPSQPGEQIIPPGTAVIVSSTQHFPHYSVAISSAAPPPPVSYTLPTSSPFNIHMSQPLQRIPEHQTISAPPPPPPSSSYGIGLPPTQAPHFQAHFGGIQPNHPQSIPQSMPQTIPQSIPAHLIHQTQQPPPPPPPPASQPQYQQHPQGISYWVSQT